MRIDRSSYRKNFLLIIIFLLFLSVSLIIALFLGYNLINKYVAKVHKASLKDEVVGKAFLYVMGLLKPPTSLFHPRIFWRVMKA